MQRLMLVVLLLAATAGIVAILFAGVRTTVAGRAAPSPRHEGSNVQKLAYIVLVLLIAGASAGLLGGM